ncbi:PREDICTED: venom allergen 3-like [Bactrocera latifrons]|uniref:Venom allergen 5 n=1 Tax=Bactrocera latifrons TaxID=174628 RepID=A0A0K8VZA7_BACLA|nr:PREDICTED: venom allergen 3-like [Bactrocera latifrons]
MNLLELLILNMLMMATEVASKTVIDYCKLGCAKPKMQHAVCANRDKKLIANCPKDTKILSLDGMQHIILQLHNERREFVASGKKELLPPAARMGELFWDEELADLAEYSVRRCLISDPHCYTTPTLRNPGRSANIYKYEKTEVKFEELVSSRVVNWLDTATECTAEIAANFPEDIPGHVDFFGRAITDSNNQVGCAASEWVKKSNKYFLLVCLYTKDVQAGKRLYKFGRPASRCLSGSSNLYKSLCSTEEDYKIADAMQEHRRLSDFSFFYKNGTGYNAPEGSLWQLVM